jgi:enoyl-CoA hydratase/carnithine racemase
MPHSAPLNHHQDRITHQIDAEGVLRLTLNDEGKRNALSEAMLTELQVILDQAAQNAAVRVIVIAALGPAFCAGHDLKEITAARAQSDSGRAFFTKLMDQCAGVMQTIVNHPKPVIAEVEGVATAAGCQLVASCQAHVLRHQGCILAYFVRRRWWRCHAMLRINMPWRCCSPAMSSMRAVQQKSA